jgi:hypothetical protein
MYTEFNLLPHSARVWIYQASRKITESEQQEILNDGRNFIESWTAHQAELKGSVKILHDLFLIFAVDESHNDASGCSIDKKIHFIRETERKFNIDFFDRMSIAYFKNETVEIAPLKQFTQMLHDGELSENTQMFNNVLFTLEELNTTWVRPVKDSWVKQYLRVNSN